MKADLYDLRRRAWNSGFQSGSDDITSGRVDINLAINTANQYGDQRRDFLNGYASAIQDGVKLRSAG